jgi:hypothetical protein
MPRQTLMALVLGAWIAGTLFMWAVATQNFRVVDRLLPSHPDSRLLMRHQASEVNRLFFDRWGWAQIALGAIFTWLAFSTPTTPRTLRWCAIAMLLIALTLQFAIVPETIRLGRLLDFAPRDPPPPESAPFWRLHAAYTGLDGTRLLLSLFAAFRLVRG